MKVFAALLLLAALALCNAQVPVPATYQGPITSNQNAPVPALNVKIGSSNFVQQWSFSVITAIRAARIGLFNTTRLMALVHVAMHDTIQGFDRQYATYQTGLALPPTKANVQAAISGAAFTVFQAYFGGSVVELSKYTSVLIFQNDFLRRNGVSDSRIAAGFLYGSTVANSLIALRATDGYNVIPTFVPQTGPGFWRPTPPNFPSAAGQGWGAVTPWGLTQPVANFYPVDQNTYFNNASRYLVDYLEVLGRGRSTVSKTVSTLQRTGVETFIAVFWANDFGGTSLPPGQYLETAQIVAGSIRGISRGNYTRTLALVALLIANTNIVVWNVKYNFQEWRPIAAIQEAATDVYSETVADLSWTPLSLTTPAFPDYVSGHASFGYGLAQVLRYITGTNDYEVTIPSDNLPQVTANYLRFSDIAEDNSISRLYLGVHFRAALTDSQQVGESIANNIVNNLLVPL